MAKKSGDWNRETDRGHVFGGEFVGRVRDEEARLSDGAVAHHHALDGLHPRLWGGQLGGPKEACLGLSRGLCRSLGVPWDPREDGARLGSLGSGHGGSRSGSLGWNRLENQWIDGRRLTRNSCDEG